MTKRGCTCPSTRSRHDVDEGIHTPECHANWCHVCGEMPGQSNPHSFLAFIELVPCADGVVDVISDDQRLGTVIVHADRSWTWSSPPVLPFRWVQRIGKTIDHYTHEHYRKTP